DDELLTAEDIAAYSAAESETGDTIDVFVDELPTAALRVLLRDHLMWMFIGAGIAAIGFMLHPSSWLMSLVRSLLLLAGLAFGAIRLFQINGIIVELKRRASGGQPKLRDRTPPGPRLVSD